MTFAAPAQPSALAAKGPAARARGHLRGRIIIGVLPIATAAGVLNSLGSARARPEDIAGDPALAKPGLSKSHHGPPPS